MPTSSNSIQIHVEMIGRGLEDFEWADGGIAAYLGFKSLMRCIGGCLMRFAERWRMDPGRGRQSDCMCTFHCSAEQKIITDGAPSSRDFPAAVKSRLYILVSQAPVMFIFHSANCSNLQINDTHPPYFEQWEKRSSTDIKHVS